MPFEKIRFKKIPASYNYDSRPPTEPSTELPTEWGYRGVSIMLNMDQAYEFTIKGTVYIETSLEGAKAKIDVILDYAPPPPLSVW